MQSVIKKYSNGEVIVIWQSAKCIHSGVCVRGLGEVFKPKETPWVKINAATTEKIIAQVNQCPSGALSFEMDK